MAIVHVVVSRGHWGRVVVPLVLACLFAAARADAMWSTGYYRQADAATMPPSEMHFAALTHVIHTHVAPNGDGSLMSADLGMTPAASAAFISAAHRVGVKALLGVANGWPHGADFPGATDPAHLEGFVENLIALMQTRGYDGIDVDWEPLHDSEVPQFVTFISDLRAAMDRVTPRPILTAALWHQEAAVASVQDCLDQINIMTYDMARTGFMTWHNAPLHTSDSRAWSVERRMAGFVQAGVSRGKLGIGLPFYGYIWRGGTGTPTGGATAPRQGWTTAPKVSWMNYNGIMLDLHEARYERWDAAALVPYLSIDRTAPEDDVFVTYENPSSIAAKVEFARSRGYGGWIIWELSADYYPEGSTMAEKHPLVEAIRDAMEAGSAPKRGTATAPSS